MAEAAKNAQPAHQKQRVPKCRVQYPCLAT
jgi:hypothetical protein